MQPDFQKIQSIMGNKALSLTEMAHNAGVMSVAVTSGAQPEEVLASEDPAACLTSLASLPEWLERRAAEAV